MADFDRYSNYNSNAGVGSVVFGAKAPLLEVEQNELQQIINSHQRKVLNALIPESKVGINSKEYFSYAGAVLRVEPGLTIVYKGNVYSYDKDSIVLNVALSGSAYLHVGEITVNHDDTLYESGYYYPGNSNAGVNTPVTNYIMDDRLSIETTRRKVLSFYISDSSTNRYAVEPGYSNTSSIQLFTMPSVVNNPLIFSDNVIVINLSDMEVIKKLQEDVDSLVGHVIEYKGILSDFDAEYAIEPENGTSSISIYLVTPETLHQPSYYSIESSGYLVSTKRGAEPPDIERYTISQSYYAFYNGSSVFTRSRQYPVSSSTSKWSNKLGQINENTGYLEYLTKQLGKNFDGVEMEFNLKSGNNYPFADYATMNYQNDFGINTFQYGSGFYENVINEIIKYRKVVNITDDGRIVAVLGDENFSYTGKAEHNFSAMGDTITTGTNLQIMVFQPKYYYKRELVFDQYDQGYNLMNNTFQNGNERIANGYAVSRFVTKISLTKRPGYKCHPAFLDKNGNEIPGYLIGCYHAIPQDQTTGNYVTNWARGDTIANDYKLSSVAGSPIVGYSNNIETVVTDNVLTPTKLRGMAFNRGDGFQLLDYEILCSELLLATMYLESFDPIYSTKWTGDTDYARGYFDSFDTETPWNQKMISNDTDVIPLTSTYHIQSYSTIDYSHHVPIVGGVMNLWGNIATFIDGVSKQTIRNTLHVHRGPIVSTQTHTETLGSNTNLSLDSGQIKNGNDDGRYCLAYSSELDYGFNWAIVKGDTPETIDNSIFYGNTRDSFFNKNAHTWNCCNLTYGFPNSSNDMTEVPPNMMMQINSSILNYVSSEDAILPTMVGGRLCYRGEIKWKVYAVDENTPPLT